MKQKTPKPTTPQPTKPTLKPGKGASDEEHRRFRLNLMRFYEKRPAGTRDDAFAAQYGIAPRTFRRWKQRWQQQGEDGIRMQSRRPLNMRPSRIDDPALRSLAARRCNDKLRGQCGARQLRTYLAQRGYDLSLSTAKRLRRKLLAAGMVKPVRAGKRGTILGKAKRTPACNALAIPYERADANALTPGEHFQVDTAFVSFQQGKMAVIIAVDIRTRMAWFLVVHEPTSTAAAELLERVRQQCQQMRVAQVDGGSEFRGEFAKYCADNRVDRMVNPKNRPTCNAFVESLVNTLRRECFASLPSDASAAQIRRHVRRYERYYNSERRHSSLGDESPIMAAKRLALRAA